MAPPRTPHDDFARHYAEKFWAFVPEIYRFEDGTAEHPGQLRALVEMLAEQAAIERRSIDRLLADSRIAEADDWAVAYIGQLLGTRLLNPLNSAGRRADVAHTLAYRRRAGTARLLEVLAHDVAGWDAVAQEAFQNLFRYPHALDRDFPLGSVTHTPKWGFPDLRRIRIADVIGGPFEDMAYRPEFRPGRGTRGRYNIPKVNLFCYRKQAFPLAGATPFRLDAKHYTIDPSGRANVPLFQLGDPNRPDCQRPAEWDVRMPITCLRLNAVRYCLPASQTNGGVNWDKLVGRVFESLDAFLDAATAAGAGTTSNLLIAALDPNCPKSRLLAWSGDPAPSISLAIGNTPLAPHEVVGANLDGWADSAVLDPQVEALVDPVTGQLQLVKAPAEPPFLKIVKVGYGILSPVGAGTNDRTERIPAGGPAPVALTSPVLSSMPPDIVFGDCRTYTPVTGSDRIDVTGDARVWATNLNRPYVQLQPSAGATTIEVRAKTPLVSLEINGLWLGSWLSGAAAGGTLAELRLTGHFDRVTLTDVTLDPGGMQVALSGNMPNAIPHLRLVVDGIVENLIIDRCILGSVQEAAGAGSSSLACTAAQVTISDSILLPHNTDPVVSLESADITIERSTILGDCFLGRAEISNSILDGVLEVQDAQGSCLRFSMVRSGGRVPSPYECVILDAGLPPGSFESVRFGDAGLCVITPACPPEVATGGENRTEMGAFNRALEPIKRADLEAKIAEFAPIQAVVQLVIET